MHAPPLPLPCRHLADLRVSGFGESTLQCQELPASLAHLPLTSLHISECSFPPSTRIQKRLGGLPAALESLAPTLRVGPDLGHSGFPQMGQAPAARQCGWCLALSYETCNARCSVSLVWAARGQCRHLCTDSRWRCCHALPPGSPQELHLHACDHRCVPLVTSTLTRLTCLSIKDSPLDSVPAWLTRLQCEADRPGTDCTRPFPVCQHCSSL